MNAVTAIYKSTVGKKVAMALTGLVMSFWVVVHMLGNLQVFLGAETLNHYGELIQSNKEVLWGMRLTMLAMLVIHVVSFISLRGSSANARKVAYQGGRTNFASTASSKFMRISGFIILAWIVFHILDLTVGLPGLHADFIHGDVYHNLTHSMGTLWKAGVYVLAAGWVALHLYHAMYSVLQTLGINQETVETGRQLGLAISLLVFLGNTAIVVFATVMGMGA